MVGNFIFCDIVIVMCNVRLNGDIGLIPVSGNAAGDYCVMSTSPPSKEDFQKMMMEWQQLVNIEVSRIDNLFGLIFQNKLCLFTLFR